MNQTIKLNVYNKNNNEYYFKINDKLYLTIGYDYIAKSFFCFYDWDIEIYNTNTIIINLSIDDVNYIVEYLDTLLEVFEVDIDWYPDIIRTKKLLKFKTKLKLL